MNTNDEIFDADLEQYARHLEEIYHGYTMPASVNWPDLRARFAQATRPGPGSLTIRLEQDQLLLDRYRIVGQVGRGGFASVYRAEDLQYRSRLVALKEMSQNGLNPEELAEDIESFQREAQMLASLQHPHLPRIYDHFETDGHWYLVMDFIEGETLEAYFQRQTKRRLAEKAVLEIGLQLCSVLEYLHTRRPPIIFRDLKPDNIMRTASGHLYLIDFGIARHFKPGQIKDTIPFGSPGYAAPEQYGKTQTTQRSDIYSLGVLLHHLLCGHDPAERPFLLPPLRLSGLPGVADLVTRMTQLDAALRPASIGEVQAMLRRLATADGTSLRALAPIRQGGGEILTGKRSGIREGAGSRQEQVFASERSEDRRSMVPVRRPSRRAFVIGGLAASAAALVGAGGAIFTLGLRRTATLAPPLEILTRIPHPGGTFQPTPEATFAAPQRQLIYRGHTTRVEAVAWSPRGDLVASADTNFSFQVWHANTGTQVAAMKLTGVAGLSWTPDGKYILAVDTVGDDGSVRAWNPLTDQVAFTYPVDRDGAWSVACSSDGQLIGVGSYDGVHVLNTANGSVVFQDLTPQYAQAHRVAWSGDGSVFAWVMNNGYQEAKIWQRGMQTDTVYRQGSSPGSSSVGISHDGTLLAVGLESGRIYLWNTHEHRLVLTYIGHLDIVTAIQWSPDGTYVASASADSQVRVWNPLSGETLTTYRGHLAGVNSLSWSPDSTRIASGGDDFSVQIWKALP